MNMEASTAAAADDDDDLTLVKAAVTLLADLEKALPRILWNHSNTDGKQDRRGRVHLTARLRDRDHAIGLIEAFQSEPQLLDAKLRVLLPDIVAAYVEILSSSLAAASPHGRNQIDMQSTVSILLYTLCKVRGYKVIIGFFNNEPRYLEIVLKQLESKTTATDVEEETWHSAYILLLWLSHLLLTPFDLTSISTASSRSDGEEIKALPPGLPSVARRILHLGLQFLKSPSKNQDAAALLLTRLVRRPDMQKLRLADAVVAHALQALHVRPMEQSMTVYDRLGPLRFLASIPTSVDLSYLIPGIYKVCHELSNDASSALASNAIAKKNTVKILRNIAIACLRSGHIRPDLSVFQETTGAVENVIDFLLRSLEDPDTPVRYAAAKGLSLIVLELETEMGYEVIQAILDMFKEDMPRHGKALDFRTVNSLKWHGLTLALSHTLFKRSASPSQLSDISKALSSALQFEQRTATGSSIGTNVRDAANFGIWSLARRYTTKELLTVDHHSVNTIEDTISIPSIIQIFAVQLMLAACLDPAGNIRRGSSAALQELVGRHPNQIHDGIALIQIVDYHAVGLRRRAMMDVANSAAVLHETYRAALLEALIDWRGLGSPDVPSRDAAAASLAKLSQSTHDFESAVLLALAEGFGKTNASDVERLHGPVLALAHLLEQVVRAPQPSVLISGVSILWDVLEVILDATNEFSARVLRSELPTATARLLAALSRYQLLYVEGTAQVPFKAIETLVERLYARHEDSILQAIPALAQTLILLQRKASVNLECIELQNLCKKVTAEGLKSTLNGACRSIALGILAGLYRNGISSDEAEQVANVLASLVSAPTVDWRIIGVRALEQIVRGASSEELVDGAIIVTIASAIHEGLNDYTIDVRGDVGSLVRLQAIQCWDEIMQRSHKALVVPPAMLQLLHADIIRLSLEKLDRVRLAAARSRQRHHSHLSSSTVDASFVCSHQYFHETLKPLLSDDLEWITRALLEGCISCAGISAENLLQASRSALIELLDAATPARLASIFQTYTSIILEMTQNVSRSSGTHPALALLGFLLSTQLPRYRILPSFKWRSLLSAVQKSHHKSNDISKLLAAVWVYRELAGIGAVRDESVKKMCSMLATNPYPRVRVALAEALFVVTRDEALKDRNWSATPIRNKEIMIGIQERALGV